MGATGFAVVDFGSTMGTQASANITGQTGILAGLGNSLVEAWINPVASPDHTVDEHIIEDLRVNTSNIVSGVGFTINLICDTGTTYGKWNVYWVWE